MTNNQLARHIKNFKRIRQQWIDALVENPNNTAAPKYIMEINAKIDLLQTLWNWSEEGEIP